MHHLTPFTLLIHNYHVKHYTYHISSAMPFLIKKRSQDSRELSLCKFFVLLYHFLCRDWQRIHWMEQLHSVLVVVVVVNVNFAIFNYYAVFISIRLLIFFCFYSFFYNNSEHIVIHVPYKIHHHTSHHHHVEKVRNFIVLLYYLIH